MVFSCFQLCKHQLLWCDCDINIALITFSYPKQHTDIFDLVSGIQKEAIKEEKMEKERRRALKERKRLKERQRGKELDPEQEDKDEEVLPSGGVK